MIKTKQFENTDYFFFFSIFLLLVVSENLGIYDIGQTSLRRFGHLLLVLAVCFYIYWSSIFSKFVNFSKFQKFSAILYLPVLMITFLIISTIFNFLLDPSYPLFKFKRLVHWSLLLVVYWLFVFFSSNSNKYNLTRIFDFTFYFVIAVSLLSIADYFLVKYGIYLIKGNSLGTDGKELLRSFPYYKYHRLQGFFKEPIFYSAFVLPFLAVAYYKKSFFGTFVISVSVFLTLSLVSLLIVAALLLLVLVFGLDVKYRYHTFKYLAASVFGFFVADLLSFSYADSAYSIQQGSLNIQQGSVVGYLKYRQLLMQTDGLACSFSDRTIFGSLYCKLESLPGRGHSLKYLVNSPLSFFGTGLSSPFVELKIRQSSILFPSIYSGLLALYFQGGLISLFVIFYFISKQAILIILRLKRSACDPLGFSLLLSFLSSFLVYFLILEEPSLVFFALIGCCVGYFNNNTS